ncbi:hypothetical protein ACFVTY_22595 [Streptomyces sp. NPDC058067]|uniref:hypothetical protein n=1 Tax=Streptomyces sp. NPDC058067 TaxID=3346324 RepID=UPI0036EC1F28
MEREDRLLMLALAGEPLPPEDRGDPEAAAAYAEAAADVALLGEQLRGIGDALAADPGRVRPPAPVVRLRPHRPRLRLALGSLAAVGACGIAGVMMWLVAQPGDYAASGGADKSVSDNRQAGKGAELSPEGFVACSRIVVEGTVDRVAPVPGIDGDRITLMVTHRYKPARGPAKVTFWMDHGVDPRLKPGDHTLITIPKGADHPDNWATGKEIKPLRDMIVKALPGSRGLACDRGPGPAL